MADSLLCDNAEIVMGQSPPGQTCNTTGSGLPLLNGPTEYGPHYPTPVQFTTDARKRARKGDVLFCVRGSTTGRMNWADRDYAIGRGVAAIRHRTRPELQPFVRAVIEYGLPGLLAQATGSTFPNVSADQLAGLWWPPLEENEQRAIAHILGTLDDKIELNRRMSETLEAMARALFKSWFVDFDPVRAKAEGRDLGLPAPLADLFPDSFEHSELGEIPTGWGTGSILDRATLLSGGTPKTDRADYWEGDIPWASAKDVSQCGQVFLVATERTISDKGLEESATQLIPAFSTVVVARGATTGRMALLGHRMAMNQTCYALTSSRRTPFALNCQLRQGIDELVRAAHGSVFDTITTSTFTSARFVLSPGPLVDAFEKLASPLFWRVLKASEQSRTLGTLRETLLPKLISGELRVRDADRAAGGVT
jgi:type I restriction enzyme S subunit